MDQVVLVTNLMVALFTHSFTLGMIHMIHWIFVPFAKGSSESPAMDGNRNDTLTTPQSFSVTQSATVDNQTEPDVRNTQNRANQAHLVMYHMDFNLLLARLNFRILHDAVCFWAAWPWSWSTGCHWLKKTNKNKQRNALSELCCLRPFNSKVKPSFSFSLILIFNDVLEGRPTVDKLGQSLILSMPLCWDVHAWLCEGI